MNIFLSTKADKQLCKLPRGMYELILNKIESLKELSFPIGVKKLVGRECWRLRVGDYRILYNIDNKNKEITILSVAHRKEAYR
jgi:mRNA interferase RelE/StbE